MNKLLFSTAVVVVGYIRYKYYWDKSKEKPYTISFLCHAKENYTLFNAFAVINFALNQSIINVQKEHFLFLHEWTQQTNNRHIFASIFKHFASRLNLLSSGWMFAITALNTTQRERSGKSMQEKMHLVPVLGWIVAKTVQNYLLYPELRAFLLCNVLSFAPFLYLLQKLEDQRLSAKKRKVYKTLCIVAETLPFMTLMNYAFIQHLTGTRIAFYCPETTTLDRKITFGLGVPTMSCDDNLNWMEYVLYHIIMFPDNQILSRIWKWRDHFFVFFPNC